MTAARIITVERRDRHRLAGIFLVAATGLVAVSPIVLAQVNLGFEHTPDTTELAGYRATASVVPGWRARGDETIVTLDGAVARSGERSLRVDAALNDGRAGFAQDIDARDVDGDRLRLSAYVRADAGAAASLRVRIDGAGRLLYIAREGPTQNADARGWRRISIDAPLSSRAERISVGGDVDGPGSVWFDDFAVESLDARTLSPPAPAADRYVRRALAMIEANAVTRARLDWSTYRAAVMTQARGAVSVSDAHLAVQFALSELGDGHSYFMSPRQMSRLDAKPVGNARSGRTLRTPEARLLSEGIAYLRLPGIAGGEHLDRVAFAEAVQALIADLASQATTGWILDLRGNEGGNLWPMLAGIGPLLGDGETGASLRPEGERRSIWYRDGKAGLGDFVQLRVRGAPARLERADVPVAVLIDGETASAAEIIATAFSGRHPSRSFGQPTVGATTATRTFPLSDGAALMLAVASVTDRQGRIVAGRILPDEIIADARRDGLPLDAQPAVLAARRWLETHR